MIRLALALLLLATSAQAADDGWFFFSWDAVTGKWDRSPKIYPTLTACERGVSYKAFFSEERFRYIVMPCVPADASTPPIPGNRFVLEQAK